MGSRRGAAKLVSSDGISPLVVERRDGLRAGRGVCLFAALIGSLIFAACATSARDSQTVPSRELVIGFPEGNTQDANVGSNQFTRILTTEGLTVGNVDGRSAPKLAESWRWENDGLTLRLHLRKGVFFHDGTPLTSTVVVRILRAAAADPNAHSLYSALSDITAIRPDGDLQVLIDLSQRSAFLPDDLDLPLPIRPDVGTGPFRLVSKGAEVLFERFDRYYLGVPTVERIHVKTFDALRNAWSSLLRGDVDMVTDVPAEAVEFIQTQQVDVLRYKRRYQYMLAFNSRSGPFTAPAVRRALNFAVNREAIIQRALRGYGTAATSPLWPRHWAYDSSAAPFSFDQRQANSILDDAGLTRGKAGAASRVPNARFKFTCLLAGDFSLHERLGLELQKQLYDVGVDMQFEVVSLDEYNQRIPEGKFEAVLVDLISGPSFARPYIFWRSASRFHGSNVFGYENAEAERLFELLRSSPLNEAATRSATNRLQRVFLEDPPALSLAWSERARVVGPKFRPVNDPDRDPVLSMWRWMPGDLTLASRQ
jgi:peptide/nickel transport system substrate-binding protein